MENSLCSIILMAVSNCIIPEQQVALAAGVATLTASPHWPRGSGQGSRVRALSGHRLGSWPTGQWWGATVVRRMIYRCTGWRECQEAALKSGLDFFFFFFLSFSKGTICLCFVYPPPQALELFDLSCQLFKTFFYTFFKLDAIESSFIFPLHMFPLKPSANEQNLG